MNSAMPTKIRRVPPARGIADRVGILDWERIEHNLHAQGARCPKTHYALSGCDELRLYGWVTNRTGYRYDAIDLLGCVGEKSKNR